jgi:hypothetical protein
LCLREIVQRRGCQRTGSVDSWQDINDYGFFFSNGDIDNTKATTSAIRHQRRRRWRWRPSEMLELWQHQFRILHYDNLGFVQGFINAWSARQGTLLWLEVVFCRCDLTSMATLGDRSSSGGVRQHCLVVPRSAVHIHLRWR